MKSLWRELIYQEFMKITLNGKVLDLGGSRKSHYQELFQGSPVFSVVNIDEKYGFDLNFDLEKPFPLEGASYDGAIVINTLEHIYDYKNLLRETARVLKPKSTLVIATPYLFPIHGCPDDFNRFTGDAYQKMLLEQGFSVVQIQPIGKGIFSVIYQMLFGIIPIDILQRFFKKICLCLDSLLLFVSKRYKNIAGNYPLGYVIIAEKNKLSEIV